MEFSEPTERRVQDRLLAGVNARMVDDQRERPLERPEWEVPWCRQHSYRVLEVFLDGGVR